MLSFWDLGVLFKMLESLGSLNFSLACTLISAGLKASRWISNTVSVLDYILINFDHAFYGIFLTSAQRLFMLLSLKSSHGLFD